MPQLGETVNDGTLTKWHKTVGDRVRRGEVLFEVSTDKVDTEIPSPADGVLVQILVNEGETVDVGTVLAIIGDDEGPVDVPTTSRDKAVTVRREATSAVRTSRSDAPLSPVVRKLLGEHGLDPREIAASGPQGRITRDDVLAYVERKNRKVASDESLGSLSPVVRRLLRENDIDPTAIVGSGPDGRITRRDVELKLHNLPAPEGNLGDEIVPFTNIRRLTSKHMTHSKSTSAHTLMVREVDYEHVEKTRRLYGPAFREVEGFSLSYLPFNALAALSALQEFPHLNASVGDDSLIVHRNVNLGIAVDLDGNGLVVPVIHNATTYSLHALARKIRSLASSARTKKLAPDDVNGGTFTITNPGPFGTLLTGAIINQPQVAILSTDAVVRKPVVLTDPQGYESIGIHSVGLLALTFDHRIIDGTYAARFLARTAQILGEREWSNDLLMGSDLSG